MRRLLPLLLALALAACENAPTSFVAPRAPGAARGIDMASDARDVLSIGMAKRRPDPEANIGR